MVLTYVPDLNAWAHEAGCTPDRKNQIGIDEDFKQELPFKHARRMQNVMGLEQFKRRTISLPTQGFRWHNSRGKRFQEMLLLGPTLSDGCPVGTLHSWPDFWLAHSW